MSDGRRAPARRGGARLYMVDVFAERAYAGNPLAVVIGTGLDEGMLQPLAAEINFSETCFVDPLTSPDGGHGLRIFTPAREIDFAGHPILGTAAVLREFVLPSAPAVLRLNLRVGQVAVVFEPDGEGGEVAWFNAPPMRLGPVCEGARIAAALNLGPDDLDPGAPVQVVSAGTAALLAPLRSRAALARARPDPAAFAALARDGLPPLAYLFCREPADRRNQLRARFFFEANGMREDPATGNGAAFLGAWLLHHRWLQGDGLSLRIEQGEELGRPSLVLLQARRDGDHTLVRVGGRVVPTLQGELLVSGA